MDVNEFCPDCESPGIRQFVPSILHISKAKVTHAEFNPGLGCVVRNQHHKNEIMKQKGVVEVGNDFKTPDKMVDFYDKGRAEKLKKRWEDA
jgi:hypothetical protein